MRRLSDHAATADVKLMGCDLFESAVGIPRGLRATNTILSGSVPMQPIVSLPLSALITTNVVRHTSTGRLVENLRLETAREARCLLTIFILEHSGYLADTTAAVSSAASPPNPGDAGTNEPFYRTYCDALPKMDSPSTHIKFPVFWSDKVRLFVL
jgi:hypothetical protein